METDPIIEAAKQDLADIEAQRHEIEDFLARYERYKGMAAGVPATPSKGDAPPVSLVTTRRSAPADKVMSAVHDILTGRGDALTLTAIFDGLVDRGVTIGGKNPKQNLSQKLSAYPAIKSYGKRGWYFADAIPPCMRTNSRLSDDEWTHEEGLVSELTRPIQSNGAASAN